MVKKIRNEKKDPRWKWIIALIVFLLSLTSTVGYEIFTYVTYDESTEGETSDVVEMAYTDFIVKLETGEVEKAEYTQYAQTFSFYLKNDETEYETLNPNTENFKEKLLLGGVNVEDSTYTDTDYAQKTRLARLLKNTASGVLASCLMTFLAYLYMSIFNSWTKKGHSGKEKAKKVSFADIIGMDEIKNDLLFDINLMKKEKTETTGVRITKGILLEGPPGNGKTMLAQAIATEADVNFIGINASDLTNKYVGETGRSVRRLFDKARQNAPCIVFFDEIDAIGAKRSEDSEDAVNREFNGVINTLLTQLDGLTESAGITVVAATNMASKLDPALVRPGRFDRRYYISNPNALARRDLLAHYLGDETKAKYDYDKLAGITRGCSCSEIENIVNEAKLVAIKENKPELDDVCLVTAVRHWQLKGVEKKVFTLSDKERNTLAIHEAGHAIVGHFLAHSAIREISICPTTSGAGGYTQTEPNSGENLVYSGEILGNIAMTLGGKAAEQLISGDTDTVSLGCDNDITQATKMAAGYVKFKRGIDFAQFGEFGVTELMDEAKIILDEAYEKALATVGTYKDKIIAVAGELKKDEVLSGERFIEIIGEECTEETELTDAGTAAD